jgi:hypothetical protein
MGAHQSHDVAMYGNEMMELMTSYTAAMHAELFFFEKL